MAASKNDEHAKAEVASWLDNDRQCVTTGRMAASLGLSRSKGSELLQSLARENVDKAYEATHCVVSQQDVAVSESSEETVPCTVFRLTKDDWNENAMETCHSTLVALALQPSDTTEAAESIGVAHERDAALYRDTIQDGQLENFLKPEVKLDAVGLAPQLQGTYQASLQRGRAYVGHAQAPPPPPAAASKLKASKSSSKPKKAMTAASFFGKGSKNSSKTTSSKSKKQPETKKKKSVKIPQPKSETVTAKTTAAEPSKEDEKENSNARDDDDAKMIGNADDFVGDVEEDDDDSDMVVESETKPRKHAAAAAKKKAPARRAVLLDDSEDEGDSDAAPAKKKKAPKAAATVTHGAMDAFTAKPKEAAAAEKDGSAKKPKRRRKKLVEKTTADENGYLHTETQEVWEDIPTDEEEEQQPTLVTKKMPAPVKKSTTGKSKMKQGTLTGFFAKKK